MPYFAYRIPQQPQEQQCVMNALDPLLQAILSQPEGAETKTLQSAAAAPRQHNRSNRAFSPRFDVFETEEAYHLYGDLPGVSDKKTIGIEFSDHRTLLVTGRVQRSVPKPSLSQRQIEKRPMEEKRRSLNPTVEDTDDEDDFSVVSASSTSKAVQKHGEVTDQKEEEGEKLKTWLAERTFGTFQRTFSFPSPISLEDVTAKLDSGVLQIVVPKTQFSGMKKIEIE